MLDGAGGGYLAFITGNLINMKIPCAINARDMAGAKSGTPENEIISTLSIATSSLVTILVLALGVVLLGTLIFLPAGTLAYPQGWLLMGILFNALSLLGVDGSWQRFIRGFVMVVVIMFDVISKMKKGK